MIDVCIGNIQRAEVRDLGYGHNAVRLHTLGQNNNQGVTLLLPPGTAEVVAACINVAVAAGQNVKPQEVAL